MRTEVGKRFLEQLYGRIGNVLVGAQYQSVIKKQMLHKDQEHQGSLTNLHRFGKLMKKRLWIAETIKNKIPESTPTSKCILGR